MPRCVELNSGPADFLSRPRHRAERGHTTGFGGRVPDQRLISFKIVAPSGRSLTPDENPGVWRNCFLEIHSFIKSSPSKKTIKIVVPKIWSRAVVDHPPSKHEALGLIISTIKKMFLR